MRPGMKIKLKLSHYSQVFNFSNSFLKFFTYFFFLIYFFIF